MPVRAGASVAAHLLRSSKAVPPTSATYKLVQCSYKQRYFSNSRMTEEKFKPAARVAGQRQDVWSIINEAAAATPKQPVVNMGQGFL